MRDLLLGSTMFVRTATKPMRSTNPKAAALALFIGLLIFSNQLLADVNVPIIGSSKDSGERHNSSVSWNAQKPVFTPNSKPFSPTEVGTQLQNILAQDNRGTVIVTIPDRYRADAITATAWTAYSCNLTIRKLNEAPMTRNLPARSLSAQTHKEYPALSPMRDKAKWKGEFAI